MWVSWLISVFDADISSLNEFVNQSFSFQSQEFDWLNIHSQSVAIWQGLWYRCESSHGGTEENSNKLGFLRLFAEDGAAGLNSKRDSNLRPSPLHVSSSKTGKKGPIAALLSERQAGTVNHPHGLLVCCPPPAHPFYRMFGIKTKQTAQPGWIRCQMSETMRGRLKLTRVRDGGNWIVFCCLFFCCFFFFF